MNIEELKKVGITILDVESRYFNIIGIGNFYIPENFKMEDVYKMIFDDAYKSGVRVGKLEKITEFKAVLNL